jgi:hypothetical protein
MQTVPMDPDQIEGSTLFAAESIHEIVDIPDDDEDSGPTKASGLQPSLLENILCKNN